MRKVLVADDEESVRLSLRRLLTSSFGCEVIEAQDGVSAVEVLTTHPELSLAVVDINMPVLNGLEVLEIVRQSPTHETLPFVVFSGTDDEDAAREAIALGADDFLLKPFRLAVVKPRLERALARPRGVPSRPKTSDLPQSGPVLVVDGSADFRHFVSNALTASHEVVQAATGVAALDLCRSKRPSAVIIGDDIGLLKPGLLARKIREIGCTDSALVAVVDEAGGRAPIGFDSHLQRTFVADTFSRAFRVCYEERFSLLSDIPAFTLVRNTATTSARQALGMLANTDVTVQQVTAPARQAGDVSARSTLTMARGTIAVDIELRCTVAAAMDTASGLLGLAPGEAIEEDALSAVGELTNVIAGRIQGAAAVAHGPASFTIPKIVIDTVATPERTQFALRASSPGTSVAFDVLLSARPIKVRAAA